MEDSEGYLGIVQNIILNGRHGAYAVATCKGVGSITFSLDPPVWQEKDRPEPGMYVMLYELRRKRAGWRAQHGRFVKPSDKQP